jgi:NAD(P)-dependent dehydrogenase (short-subunit alcohol dehydrogenase family)
MDQNRRNLITGALGALAVTAATAAGPARQAAAAEPRRGVLAGRTAFITGAARGIGLAIAERFAAEGADVAMIDIADPSRLTTSDGYRVATMAEFDRAVARVRAHGGKALKIQADVRDHQGMRRAAEQTARALGGIDIVVANAGYVAWHAFEDGTPEQWKDVVDVNIHGVFNTAAAAIPFLRRSRHARIITMTSIGGRFGAAGNGAYTSTKWAVIGMTKQAAAELGKYGIAVNAIAPGAVNTPMYRSEGQMRSMGVSSAAEQDRIIGPLSPLGGRGAVEPADIADTALFLASDAAATLSGTIIDNAAGFNASYSA